MFLIKKQMLTYNNPKTIINPIGIVIHETATPNATAQNEYNYFNTGNRQSSAHAFIDDKEIVQCIEWDNKAWHAGKTANQNYIGIELCHFDSSFKFNIIYSQAVELFAYLFINVLKMNIVTNENLMSHNEVSMKWKETNHTDPVSYFKKYGKTIEGFRNDVQSRINQLNEEELFKQSLQKIQSKNIISSPDYWMNNCKMNKKVEGKYVNLVILRFVAMYKIVNTFEEAVAILKNMNVVASPDYWLKCKDGFQAEGAYVRTLIKNMASKF